MGTQFFKTGGFGNQNAMKVGAKTAPISKYLKFVSPGAGMANQFGNRARREAYMPPSTGPYAGKVPKLADANRGYQAVAPLAPLPAAKTVTPGTPDRAWSG